MGRQSLGEDGLGLDPAWSHAAPGTRLGHCWARWCCGRTLRVKLLASRLPRAAGTRMGHGRVLGNPHALPPLP